MTIQMVYKVQRRLFLYVYGHRGDYIVGELQKSEQSETSYFYFKRGIKPTPFIDWNLNERIPPYRSLGPGWKMDKGCTGGECPTPTSATLHHSFPTDRLGLVWSRLGYFTIGQDKLLT